MVVRILILLLCSLSLHSQVIRTYSFHTPTTSALTFPTGATANYNFNELSGDLLDQVGSNNGTVTAPDYSASGIIGTGYDFIAANEDRISHSGWSVGSGDVSISVWLDLDVLGGAIMGDEANTGSMWIRIDGSGGMAIGSRNIDNCIFTTSTVLTTGSYQHVVVVYDQGANTITFYRNGSGDSEVESYSTTFSTATRYIGALGTTFYSIDCRMDEFTVFLGKALSASEVDDLYNSGDGLEY